jgi:hypothetical protein
MQPRGILLNSWQNSTEGAAKRLPGNFEVGYGRPPVEHRFKPGNEGASEGYEKPEGRGARRSAGLIGVREVGEVKQMTKLEALLQKTRRKRG